MEMIAMKGELCKFKFLWMSSSGVMSPDETVIFFRNAVIYVARYKLTAKHAKPENVRRKN